jgi:hypothetical protein
MTKEHVQKVRFIRLYLYTILNKKKERVTLCDTLKTIFIYKSISRGKKKKKDKGRKAYRRRN